MAGSLALCLPVLAGVGALALGHTPLWWVAAAPVVALAALLVLFFRNPRRVIPSERGLLVSPADGTVVDIAEVEEPEFIRGPAVRIGIFLSIFSVHVNRAPCSGRVEHVRYRPGKFLDARNPRAGQENESQAIGILRDDAGGPPGVRVLVPQISGAIARRIICPLEEGQPVSRGRLIGMIKYGSRTELFVAAPRESVKVRVGQKATGGETVLYAFAGSTAPEGVLVR